jgi:hypothetical protein
MTLAPGHSRVVVRAAFFTPQNRPALLEGWRLVIGRVRLSWGFRFDDQLQELSL